MTYLGIQKSWLALVLLAVFFTVAVAIEAQDADQTGVTLMEEATTNLYGTGIRVAQPEAEPTGDGDFEVNPANVGSPSTIFTYTSSNGVSSVYPNTVGTNSSHAERVAQFFYGTVANSSVAAGIATNITHVDNMDANYFFNIRVEPLVNISDAIINQSFSFGDTGTTVPVSEQEQLDTFYDNYSMDFNALFVSAVGVSGNPGAPGTAYDSISVGAYGGTNGSANSATGPTADNGRCKPDICAPDGNTSFAVPQVSGSAAVLMQAGLRGDGGPNSALATNMLTLKALLLNGAVKPLGWTNGPNAPLDARYGAGMLNLYNSYHQLTGGRQTNFVSNTVTAGSAHPPASVTNTLAVLNGWDFNTNTSSVLNDAIHHYYFNVTNASGQNFFNAAATLVWNRHASSSSINVLRLFLYNAASGNLITCSTSAVNNVQHIYVPQLPAGRYDLQVWKAGGFSTVSTAEPYGMAFAFTPPVSLAVSQAGSNVMISWPVYPAGMELQATPTLTPGLSWSTNNLPAPTVTNSRCIVTINTANAPQYFRLYGPNF